MLNLYKTLQQTILRKDCRRLKLSWILNLPEENGKTVFSPEISFDPLHRGFKSLKRMCKINHTLGRSEQVKKLYLRLLTNYSSLLMENEKSINNLLDFLSSSLFIKELYDCTLDRLEKNGNKVCLWVLLKNTPLKNI